MLRISPLFPRACSHQSRGAVSVQAIVLVGVLLLIHLSNLFAPPPPSVDAIAVAGNLGWLFVLWAYWTDRHRTTIAPPIPEQA